jgi:hypothetical protein
VVFRNRSCSIYNHLQTRWQNGGRNLGNLVRGSLLQNGRYRRHGFRYAVSITSLTFSTGGCTAVMGIKERRFDPLPREVSLEDLVP